MMSTYLGGGAYGKVYKEWVHGQWCAVKKVPEHLITDEEMYREYDVCRTVDHTNVVKLVAQVEKRGKMWCIPMEFIEGQTLKNIIFHPMRSSLRLTPLIKSRIITGMCEGLLYLHNKGIVHRDIKPDNIMVESGTNRAVIIDLGFAKFQYGGFYSGQDKGNEAYAPSEILNRPYIKRNHRSDVWALGKVIAELLVGHQLPSSRISPAHIQDLLREHPAYREPVSSMLDKPIPRATMASVIGQIREAQGQVKDNEPLHRPVPTLAPALSLQPYPNSGASAMQLYTDLRSDLPPGFSLPDPLPPNHTITLNYITRDRREGLIQIKGEIQTRQGRIHHVWWIKCVPNDTDWSERQKYLK